MNKKSQPPTQAQIAAQQRQINADAAKPRTPAEKPVKIEGGFSASLKKIANAPKPKK